MAEKKPKLSPYEDSGFVLPFSFPGERGSAPQTLGPLIFPPRGRDLTPRERIHEGFHARGGGIPWFISLFGPREWEENYAYGVEEAAGFPSDNPYKPKGPTPEEVAKALAQQKAFQERRKGRKLPPPPTRSK